MENVSEEIKFYEYEKQKLILHNSHNKLKNFSNKLIYYYFSFKNKLIIYLDSKILGTLEYFNPNFTPKINIELKKKEIENEQDLIEEKNHKEAFEIEFDEENRDMNDFKDVALYIRKEPKLIPKEGVNQISNI